MSDDYPKNTTVGSAKNAEDDSSKPMVYTFDEAIEALKNIAEAESEFLRLDAERDITEEQTGESDSVARMNEVARAADAASDRWHGELDSTDFRGVLAAIKKETSDLKQQLDDMSEENFSVYEIDKENKELKGIIKELLEHEGCEGFSAGLRERAKQLTK